MSGDPLVSVVLSVFNGARFLERSIRSVLGQEGVDHEVIAIDDGSTDDASTILDDLAAQDARLCVIHQENAGLTQALIRGCQTARGRFIARQDADDLSCDNRLWLQAESLLRDPHLSFVSCGVETIGPEDETLFETSGPEDPELATSLLIDHWRGPDHGSVMFRKDRYEEVGGYRPEFYFAQDADLWLRLGATGLLSFLPRTLYRLRITPQRLSAQFGAAQRRLGLIARQCREARLAGRSEGNLLDLAARCRPKGNGPGSRPGAGTGDLYFIGRCLLRRGDRRAAVYFRKVLRQQPWHVRALVSLVRTNLQVRRPGATDHI